MEPIIVDTPMGGGGVPLERPYKGPKISNIVCGVDLGCRFDHRYIANAGRNHNNTGFARGNKGSHFPAAVLRIKEPKCTALVFDSGKMQVLGAKTVEDAKLGARKFARILQKMGYQPRMAGFRVQNIVANVDTQMVIRLEGLDRDHGRVLNGDGRVLCFYEPEQFPGLVYRLVLPRGEGRAEKRAGITFLVFAKGKVVILGARTVEDVRMGFERFWPVLLRYRTM